MKRREFIALLGGTVAWHQHVNAAGTAPPTSLTIASEWKKAMAKAYKRLRRQRTERRLKNQSFMEPSKRPLTGKRKKSFIRSLFSKPVPVRAAHRPD
jgi:hypothetical protein